MAKKKTAKPAKKTTVKKSAKKPASKSKPVKKVAAKKAVAKKPVAKKSAPKKTAVKKVVKKSSPKAKPVKKALAKPITKPTTKVDYTKAITPLGDRLVVRLVKAESITAGGIILLESSASTEGYLKGEVLAAGQGTYTKKGHHKLLDVKIGDVVLFNDYASTKIKFNNEDLHIVHENDVLGVSK